MTKPANDKCPCHDGEEWNEKRIDIIGQNGPTGEHYLLTQAKECAAKIKQWPQSKQDTISLGKGYWTDVFDDGPLASSFPEGHGADMVTNGRN